MMSYRGYDKPDRIQDLWVISLPNMTPEAVGVSTGSQRDQAIAGHGLPWMMQPGKPGAHIMIPIDPPVKDSTITHVASDEISQAVFPLPEEYVQAPSFTGSIRRRANAWYCVRVQTMSNAHGRAKTDLLTATTKLRLPVVTSRPS